MKPEKLRAILEANLAKYRAQGKSEDWLRSYVRKWYDVADHMNEVTEARRRAVP